MGDLSLDEVQELMKLRPLQLNQEWVKVCAALPSVNERLAEAHRRYLTAKVQSERCYAMLYLEKRESADGKVTEAMLKAMVESDDDYHAQRLELVDAEADWKRVQGISRALSEKCNAISSMSANMRQEFGARGQGALSGEIDGSRSTDDELV